jgi:hypothetical protein
MRSITLMGTAAVVLNAGAQALNSMDRDLASMSAAKA